MDLMLAIFLICNGVVAQIAGSMGGMTAATNYLNGVMNVHTSLPVKAWKAEYAKLTAEYKALNGRYLKLKDEVKEAEQIRKSVYSILRQEQREKQPQKAKDMDR